VQRYEKAPTNQNYSEEKSSSRIGFASATARKAQRHSKESLTLQQGKADATARKSQRHSKEIGNDIAVGTMKA